MAQTYVYLLVMTLVCVVLFILTAGGAYFIARNHIQDPKVFIGITLTSLFVLATTTTLGIIILWGAKVLTFDTSFMNWLGGATVAEVAGILTIIVNFYFKVQIPQSAHPVASLSAQSAPIVAPVPASQSSAA